MNESIVSLDFKQEITLPLKKEVKILFLLLQGGSKDKLKEKKNKKQKTKQRIQIETRYHRLKKEKSDR